MDQRRSVIVSSILSLHLCKEYLTVTKFKTVFLLSIKTAMELRALVSVHDCIGIAYCLSCTYVFSLSVFALNSIICANNNICKLLTHPLSVSLSAVPCCASWRNITKQNLYCNGESWKDLRRKRFIQINFAQKLLPKYTQINFIRWTAVTRNYTSWVRKKSIIFKHEIVKSFLHPRICICLGLSVCLSACLLALKVVS